MDTQSDAPKHPTGERFRTISLAWLPGSNRSYGAKLRQKTKLGTTHMDNAVTNLLSEAKQVLDQLAEVT
ncbi:hypothetical protein, partial [Vibrio vulnificus]|uniref:hypothetical protein n=1 Tax=Vibrio vulnificus TaxID=672 RepID=UPI0039B6A557